MSSPSIRTISVRAAAPTLRVPHEHSPRKYITGSAAVTVPATAYYLRRLASGELVEADKEKATPAKSQEIKES